jgi:predicted nucleotidyltransferase
MASLNVDRVALAELCRRHQIRRISLFGSILRGDDPNCCRVCEF